MGDLAGRVAVVTGGAHGIGSAVCRLFAEEGAHVVVADIDVTAATRTAGTIGPSALAVRLDVTDPDSWRACAELTDATWGPATILVNNAGLYLPGGWEDATVEDFEQMFRVNQLAPLLGVRAFTPGMVKAGSGSIVNISSTGGVRPAPHSVAYATTKWAVRGLTQSLAAALAPVGIRVNTLIPGLIDTRMARANTPESIAATTSRVGSGRMGSAEEVARGCLYLCLPASAYVIGTELVVDGGLALT